jgi:NAD-dependent SIR2 family protein deacetylase
MHCLTCGRKFDSLKEQKRHEKKCRRCEDCGKVLRAGFSLKRHMATACKKQATVPKGLFT